MDDTEAGGSEYQANSALGFRSSEPGRTRKRETILSMPVPADLDAFFDSNESRIRDELFELLRIPSVSARTEHNPDTARAAEWVATSLRSAGLQATIHSTPGQPVVV